MAEAVLHCAGCNLRYRVRSYDPQKKYTCPKCKGGLKPESGGTQAADAQTLGAKDEMAPEPTRDPLLGQHVAHYRILKKLGQGGMGAVYQAENVNLKRIVALKILPPDLAASNVQYAQRFLREAQSQAAVMHPNVVSIFHVGKHENYYFIEMEFAEGGSAAGLLKGPLPVDQAVAIIRGAAEGLGEAHAKKLIHRDMKPENILLTRQGGPKVSDFGLAKAVDVASGLTTSGQVLGTPYYMSPEQCRANPLDARSDIYSLGVTFYHLLTGDRPFTADSAMAIMYHHCCTAPKDPRGVRPEIPEPLAHVCLNAMLKAPGNRYQTMGEFIADLDKAAAGQPVALRAAEEVKAPGQVVTKRAAPTPVAKGPVKTPPSGTAEVARLEDVIDQAEEQDHYLRTRRVERRIKEVQAFRESWDRFARLLEGARAGKVGEDFERVRDAVAGGYGNILPRLDQAKTMGSRVVAAAKTGVSVDDVRALSEEDFGRLKRHWEGGQALLTEYVNFLEAGRQTLLRESPLRYYWMKLMHNRVAAGLTMAAGVLLACLLGWQAVKHWPEGTKTRKSTKAEAKAAAPAATTADSPSPAVVPKPEAPSPKPETPSPKPEAPSATPDWAKGRLSKEQTQAAERSGLRVAFENSVGMKFVLIPPGEFMMGSPATEKGRQPNEGPVHRVRISRGFYMAIHEVTQRQYETVVSKNPSRIKRPDNPVETVSWPDAQEFCKKLSEKDGKTYRLPTEAEWEYACRAGSQTAFPFGDNPSDDEVGEYAWHKGNSDKEPRAVGQKKPNAWGLYDMHGNVWEWCEDRYDEKYYASSAASDPTGASSGPLRVVRGGSWGGEAWAGKSALRAAEQDPNVGYSSVGFRVVCGPTPPPQAPALAAATAQPGAPAVPPQAQKSPPARKRAPQEPHRIIYNDDGVDAQNTTPEQFLAARLKHLMDTQVDMVTFDPMDSDSIALYPSKVAELSPFPLPAAGHDPVALALKFCHEHQIEFYPSFRMNDVHHSLHKDWARTAAWTREHPQYLLGKHGDNERYSLWSPRAYWAAKDYEAPEVRERQFLIIQEFCEKYDVDGIELDWFRDPMFFRPTLDLKPVEEKHLAMMNDLVRRIRAMTERVAKKRGRPLLIACRVPLSVERSRFVGLDVPTWLKERLVDILVLGGGYACKAMAQSVREMVAFARPFKVTVYACISPSGLKTPYDTVEAWRGAAINILHEGAGVYLFNLSYGLVPPNPPDDYKRTQSFPQQVQLYKELGSVETLKGLDKTFAVDRIEEKTLLGSIRSALVLTGRLPIALKRNAWTPVVLPVGENVASHAPAGKTAYASLRLGLSEINLADKLTLRLNGQTLKAAADGASPMGANLLKNPALEEGQAVGADVPGWHSAGHDGTKSVAVRFVTCADGLKGSRAGLLESGPTYKWVYADQYVPVQVTPSHAIQFSAWLRGDKKDISMNLVMYLLVPDREGNVKDVAVAHTHFCVGTDWKPYRAILSLDEARDLPPSLDKAEVRAIVEIYQPSARVYVDNAALTTGTSSWLKLAPPADLLKAGDNLVELRLAGETPGEEVFVECLDLMVTYR